MRHFKNQQIHEYFKRLKFSRDMNEISSNATSVRSWRRGHNITTSHCIGVRKTTTLNYRKQVCEQSSDHTHLGILGDHVQTASILHTETTGILSECEGIRGRYEEQERGEGTAEHHGWCIGCLLIAGK